MFITEVTLEYIILRECTGVPNCEWQVSVIHTSFDCALLT